MTKARRSGTAWLLSVVCAGLVVWLAYGSWEISGLLYAGGQAVQGRNEDRKPIVIERSPQRVIKDQYPSFSAVAINAEENMLVVTDENLFQILEYDRRANTPPQARLTEPKRIISGPNTRAEMMCGVYIDPVTKEVYVLNNDTQNWLPVFSRDARGNATPSRYLAAPHGTFGIAVNEATQEMFLTVQHQNSVVVYRKQASGEEKPLRTIAGSDTQLEDPHGIALDTKNKLIFVSNFGNAQVSLPGSRGGRRSADTYGKFELPSITVYPLDASGNVKPLWIIEGSQTMLNWPSHLAMHEERQELFVANDADDSILAFRASDKGNVAPIRMIKGPNTGIKNPPGIALDVKNGEISVASMGTHAILFFSTTANGDVKPLRIIRGGPANQVALNIGNPGAVGYDTKRNQILVPN
jgi:DNA-binding beta-propeller fold protein YncE